MKWTTILILGFCALGCKKKTDGNSPSTEATKAFDYTISGPREFRLEQYHDTVIPFPLVVTSSSSKTEPVELQFSDSSGLISYLPLLSPESPTFSHEYLLECKPRKMGTSQMTIRSKSASTAEKITYVTFLTAEIKDCSSFVTGLYRNVQWPQAIPVHVTRSDTSDAIVFSNYPMLSFTPNCREGKFAAYSGDGSFYTTGSATFNKDTITLTVTDYDIDAGRNSNTYILKRL